jgi:hypothetical protein
LPHTSTLLGLSIRIQQLLNITMLAADVRNAKKVSNDSVHQTPIEFANEPICVIGHSIACVLNDPRNGPPKARFDDDKRKQG